MTTTDPIHALIVPVLRNLAATMTQRIGWTLSDHQHQLIDNASADLSTDERGKFYSYLDLRPQIEGRKQYSDVLVLSIAKRALYVVQHELAKAITTKS